jgi:hypothetical protein
MKFFVTRSYCWSRWLRHMRPTWMGPGREPFRGHSATSPLYLSLWPTERS